MILSLILIGPNSLKENIFLQKIRCPKMKVINLTYFFIPKKTEHFNDDNILKIDLNAQEGPTTWILEVP